MYRIRIALAITCGLIAASALFGADPDLGTIRPKVTITDDVKVEDYDFPLYRDEIGDVRMLRVLLWYRRESPALDADENGVVPDPVWRKFRTDRYSGTQYANWLKLDATVDHPGPYGFREESHLRKTYEGTKLSFVSGFARGAYYDERGATMISNQVGSDLSYDDQGRLDGTCRRDWTSTVYTNFSEPGPGSDRKSSYDRRTTYSHGQPVVITIDSYASGGRSSSIDANAPAPQDSRFFWCGPLCTLNDGFVDPALVQTTLYDLVVPNDAGYFDWIAVGDVSGSDLPDLLRAFGLAWGRPPEPVVEEPVAND